MTAIDEAAAWVEMHRRANQEISRLELDKHLARQKIMEALAGDDTGTIAGKTVVKVRPIPGRLDGKALRADHPDIAERYIGPESERFTVVPADA